MATTKKTAPQGAAAPVLDPTTPAQQAVAVSTAATPVDKTCPDPIDLPGHVLPLLDAIVWMGLASNKLSSIDGLKDHVQRTRWIDDIPGPECADAGELMSSVAWAAADLLRRYQQEQKGRTA